MCAASTGRRVIAAVDAKSEDGGPQLSPADIEKDRKAAIRMSKHILLQGTSNGELEVKIAP